MITRTMNNHSASVEIMNNAILLYRDERGQVTVLGWRLAIRNELLYKWVKDARARARVLMWRKRLDPIY